MSAPKAALQTNWLRGTVTVVDGEGGHAELQVTPYGVQAELRAGHGDQLAANKRLDDFAHELEALLDKYDVPRFSTYHLT